MSSERLYLAINCKSNEVVTEVFDPHGKCLASGAATFEPLPARSGYSEFHPEQLWRAVCSACQQVLSALRAQSGQLGAVVFVAEGNNLVLHSDDPSGCIGILSTDRRTNAFPELRVTDTRYRLKAWAINGQAVWPGQIAQVLRWFAVNEPEQLRKVEKILPIKDWVKFRLCGESVSDSTEIARSALLDISTSTITARSLAFFELKSVGQKLPSLFPSWKIIGEVGAEASLATGIPEGLPVVNGCSDVDAMAIGSGASSRGDLSITIGYWSHLHLLVPDFKSPRNVFAVAPAVLPGLWTRYDNGGGSGNNLDWFLANTGKDILREASLSGTPVFQFIDWQLATLAPCTNPVFFHPYLLGDYLHQGSSGGFYGLRTSTDRRQLLGAVLEGATLASRVYLDRVLDGQTTSGRVFFAGQAAASEYWRQMFADATGMEMLVPERIDAVGLGAAMCAAVALGDYPDLASAAASMSRPAIRIHPRIELRDAYAERYAQFLKITEAMEPVWELLNERLEASLALRLQPLSH